MSGEVVSGHHRAAAMRWWGAPPEELPEDATEEQRAKYTIDYARWRSWVEGDVTFRLVGSGFAPGRIHHFGSAALRPFHASPRAMAPCRACQSTPSALLVPRAPAGAGRRLGRAWSFLGAPGGLAALGLGGRS